MDLDPRGAHAPSPAAATVPAELVEHAPEGLAVIDADARFVEANPAAVVLCGLRPGAVTGTRSPFPPPGADASAQGRRVDRGVAAGARRPARVRLRAQPDARTAAVGGVVPGRDREPAAPAEAGRHRQGRVQRGVQAVPRGHPRDARPRGAADGLARRRPGAHDEPGGRPAARDGGGGVRPRSRLLRQAHGVPGPRRPAGHARGARDTAAPRGGRPVRRDPAGPRLGAAARAHAPSPVGLVRERAAPRPRGTGRHPERLLRAGSDRRRHRARLPARHGRAGGDGGRPCRPARSGTGRRPPGGAAEAGPRPARLGRAAGLLDDDAGAVAGRARRARAGTRRRRRWPRSPTT